MAITQSQYTAPDKTQGDIWSSDEHNEIKTVLNQKTDADNTILIEGDQVIDGNLTMKAVVGTTGTFSDQLILTKNHDHIKLVSTRTDQDASKDRTALLMAKADSDLDLYLYSTTDDEGKFYVSSAGTGWFQNRLITGGRLTIAHRAIADDPKAVVISSGANATTTPTDIIWSRDNREAARMRFDSNFDMHLAVNNNDNLLRSRISLGSQRLTGLKYGVNLYDGDESIKSLHTVAYGVVIPSGVEDNAGLQLSSVTTTGRGGEVNHNSGSVYFRETTNGKEGIALDYYGGSRTDANGRYWDSNRLYISRWNNATYPEPIVHFNKTDSNITHYGGLIAETTMADQTKRTWQWMQMLTAPTSTTAGKLVLSIDGPAILHGGDKAGDVSLNHTGEDAIVSADFNLYFHSNLQNGWASRKSMSFNTGGDLTVARIVYATNFQFTSDITLKENVKPLDTSIDVDFIEFNFEGSDTKRYGVSAQDVQAVLPELVSEDDKGNLTVAMVDFLILKVAELEKKVKELTK